MQHFDTIQKSLAPELAELNGIISQSLATDNALMNSVVTGYLDVKGKQIRPILVILSAKFFGGVNEEVLYAGAALEMLHNASLIHDDVVDETTLRRNRPTINAIEGNHMAVLVGDFFVSKALEAGIHTGNVNVVAALSELGAELSLGEVDQICNVRRHNFDEASYIGMIRKKTASLFRKCVSLGARTSGATEEEAAPLVEFAELLGICFQIRDDIFDYFDDKKLIGKPTGNDLRESKVTLPLLYALNNPDFAEEGARFREIIMRGELSQEEIYELVDFAKRAGGIDYAYEYMRSVQQKALQYISQYPDSKCRRDFEDLFEFIIQRDR